MYFTSQFGDPSIPINLYNQIVNNVNFEAHIFVENKIKQIINYLKDYLSDEVIITTSNPNSNKNTPEPKIESHLTINGYHIPILDTDTWYNNSYVKLILILAVFSTVITIVWYNGDTIKEWSIYTTSVTVLINLISKLFGKKPGNGGNAGNSVIAETVNAIISNQLDISSEEALNSNVEDSNPVDAAETESNNTTPKASTSNLKDINIEKEAFGNVKTKRSKAYKGTSLDEREFNHYFDTENRFSVLDVDVE
jgi:hypothetical protein